MTKQTEIAIAIDPAVFDVLVDIDSGERPTENQVSAAIERIEAALGRRGYDASAWVNGISQHEINGLPTRHADEGLVCTPAMVEALDEALNEALA